jgi:hypothetical protein
MKTACFKGIGCPEFPCIPMGMHFISSGRNVPRRLTPSVVPLSATVPHQAARAGPSLSTRFVARSCRLMLSVLRDVSRNTHRPLAFSSARSAAVRRPPTP